METDPLIGYDPNWRESMQGGGVDPNDPLANYSPHWRDNIEQFGVADARLTTAQGRETVDLESRQRAVARFDEILQRPGLSPAQRRHVQKLRDDMDPNRWTRETTEQRNPLENIGRGLATGLARTGTGLADLTGAAINVALPGRPGQGIRDWAQEAAAQATEYYDPQGAWGLTGSIGGELAGSAIPYTVINRVVAAKALLPLLQRTSSPAAQRLTRLIQMSEASNAQAGGVARGIATRGLGQTIISLPTDAFQALTMEDASWNDILLQMGISVGANFLGGGLLPGSGDVVGPNRSVLPKPPGTVDLTRQPPAGAPAPAATTKIDQMVAAGDTQAEANKKIAAQKRQARNDAIKAWREANPGKKWKELPPEDKAEWITQHMATQAATVATPANPNPNQTPIGDRSAFDLEAPKVDADDDLVYVFGDLNGLKGINDRAGYDAGNQFIANTGQILQQVLEAAGVPKRVFRYGGDEFVAVVPKDKAVEIRDALELATVQKIGGETGSMSADIFPKLSDVLSPEGAERIKLRKTAAKAVHGIAGRDAAEQAAIDAAARKLANKQAGQGDLFGGTPAQGTQVVKPEPPPEQYRAWDILQKIRARLETEARDGITPRIQKELDDLVAAEKDLQDRYNWINRDPSKRGQVEAVGGGSGVAGPGAGTSGAEAGGGAPGRALSEVGDHEAFIAASENLNDIQGDRAAEINGPQDLQTQVNRLAQPELTKHLNPGSSMEQLTFETPDGTEVMLVGSRQGDTFKIEYIGGPAANTVGPGTMRQIHRQLLETTGMKRVTGERVSGAAPTGRTVTTGEPELPIVQPPAEGPSRPWSSDTDRDSFVRRYQDELAKGRSEEDLDAEILKEIGGDELVSMMAKISENKVGASFDKSLFKKLGATLYERGIELVVIKETLQNAIDAVRGRSGGVIKIDYNSSNRTFRISDNGTGMPPEVAAKEFLDVGGSFKAAENSSGGFGIAKVGIFSNADRLRMQSVADTPTGRKMTTIEGSADDWVNGEMRYAVEDVSDDIPTGTMMDVEFNKEVEMGYGAEEFLKTTGAYSQLGDLDIIYNGKSIFGKVPPEPPRPRPRPENFNDLPDDVKNEYWDQDDAWHDWNRQYGSTMHDGSPRPKKMKGSFGAEPPELEGLLQTIDLPSATLKIYTTVDRAEPGLFGSLTDLVWLNNGYFQISDAAPSSPDHPLAIVVDVAPKVDVTDPNYPFTLSREGVRKEVKDAVKKVMDAVNQQVRTQQSNQLYYKMMNAPRMREAPEYQVLDTSGGLPEALEKQIADREYAAAMTTQVGEYLNAITNKLVDRLQLVAVKDWGGKYPDLRNYTFMGIGLGQDYLGVNIDRTLVGKRMAEAGVELHPDWPNSYAILFNPYSIMNEVRTRSKQLDTSSIPLHTLLAEYTVGTMWHELIHNVARGHDEKFAGALTRAFGPTIRESVDLMDSMERMWETLLDDPDFMGDYDAILDAWSQIDKNANIFKAAGGKGAAPARSFPLGGDATGSEAPGRLAGRGGGGEGALLDRTATGGSEGRGGAFAGGDAEVSGARTVPPDEAIRALKRSLKGQTPEQKFETFRQIYELYNREAIPEPTPDLTPPLPNPTDLDPAPAGVAELSPETLPNPPTPTPPPTATTRPEGPDWLENADHVRPISEMSMDEVDDMKDVIGDALDALGDDAPASLERDLKKLANRTLQLRAEGKRVAQVQAQPDLAAQGLDVPVAAPRTREGRRVEPRVKDLTVDEDTGTKRAVNKKKAARAEREAKKLEDQRVMMFRKNPTLMDKAELEIHKIQVEERLAESIPDSASWHMMNERLRRVNQAIAKLADTSRQDGVLLHTPPELGGSIAGFMIGAAMGDDPEERRQYALTGAMLGGGAGFGLRRFQGRPGKKSPAAIPGQAEVREVVITQEELDAAKPLQSFLSRAESWYQNTVRPSWAIEKATTRAGGKRLPAHLNPGKRAAMFGAWISQSEEFMFGRPSLEGPDGNRVPIPGVLNAQEISKMAQGDTQSLGDLMAAMTVIEQYQLTGKNRTGMNLAAAVQFAKNAPQHLHDAVLEARKLHLAMLDVMLDAGIISPEARVKMAQEQFYAPLERVFGSTIGQKPLPVGTKPGSKNTPAPNPVKGRKAPNIRPVRNPFETMVQNIPRVMRAAEMNKSKISLIELRQANPDALEGLIDYAPGSKKNNNQKFQAKVAQLQQEIDLTSDEAAALVAAFDPEGLTPISNSMSVWRNGKLETWRLDPYIAAAFQTMLPKDLEPLWALLGAFNSPARTGIVNNPLFIARQAFRDNWQATLNSNYGFRFGIDWARGWWEGMRRSPEYRNYLAGGGGHSSFAQREVLNVRSALRGVKTEGRTAIGTAARQFAAGDWADAWHTMITPITEAARVGEYLRARGRGEAVVESVFAAKEVVGNFQRIAPAIRGFAHGTLFLNPALKSLDVAAYSAGVHPFRTPEVGRKVAAARYLTKAFVLITAPSIAFYVAGEGDQEIEDLRRTEQGKKFWWIRGPDGTIHKFVKPIFEGQVFGTSVEIALDKMRDENPEAFKEFVSSVGADAAFNLLPTMGVIPISLWANKDWSFNSPIVPGGVENVESQYQMRQNSSIAARVMSDIVSPVTREVDNEAVRRMFSPAGIDYMIRGFGGTNATEAMLAATQVSKYMETNLVPPAVEWPVIRSGLVNVPFAQVKPVEDFYKLADRVDRRAKTFNHLAQTDIAGMMEYMQEYRFEIMQADMFAKNRAKIADMRQAMEDLRNAPPGLMNEADKRKYSAEIQRQIIELARLTVDFSRMMSAPPQ